MVNFTVNLSNLLLKCYFNQPRKEFNYNVFYFTEKLEELNKNSFKIMGIIIFNFSKEIPN